MLPSRFAELLPHFSLSALGVPDAPAADNNVRAKSLTAALFRAAALDFEDLTGEVLLAPPPRTEPRKLAAFGFLLSAAALRAQAQITALNAVKVHNPDVQQNVAFNLDLVRVIGRASFADQQRARTLLIRRGQWLSDLTAGRR